MKASALFFIAGVLSSDCISVQPRLQIEKGLEISKDNFEVLVDVMKSGKHLPICKIKPNRSCKSDNIKIQLDYVNEAPPTLRGNPYKSTLPFSPRLNITKKGYTWDYVAPIIEDQDKGDKTVYVFGRQEFCNSVDTIDMTYDEPN